MHPSIRVLLAGTSLGALILGAGGRLAMALVAVQNGARPAFSLGGTVTVIALGAASGLAGAVILLASSAIARRAPRGGRWLAYLLLGLGLLAVTMRGLRGSPASSHVYFYVLVAVYGVALALFDLRRQRIPRNAQSQRPGRLASE